MAGAGPGQAAGPGRGPPRLHDAFSGAALRDLRAPPPAPSVVLLVSPVSPGRAVLSPDGQLLAVPEPGILGLLAAGSLTLFLRRRRMA